MSPRLRNTFPSCPAALALATATALLAGPGLAGTQPPESFAPGRILVMPKAGLPEAALQALIKQQGATRARSLGRSGLALVDLPPGLERQLVERLQRHPHVDFAELDERVSLQASNDPYLGSQWHLSRTGATIAWATSTGAGVTIAILDTGVDGTHPDLKDRMVPGWNAYDGNTDTRDVHGHGTAVAGSAAATLNNGTGVAAPAGAARIMPVRVSQPDGYAYFSTIATALNWAADNGAKVANISYGVSGSSSVQNAADYLKSKGGLAVVSAGNNGKDEAIVAHGAMITVSATDSSDNLTSWSSWGKMVDLSAPGAGIYTTNRGGGYGSWNGTSFSAPITAGVVAQMMAANPQLKPAELESILFSTAVDRGTVGYDVYYGWGRVNAEGAVATAAAAVTATDVTPPAVAVSSPSGGSTASGIVTVDVAATDDKGVSRVDLYVNGGKLSSDSSTPYSLVWDTRGSANGNAELKAVAVDAAGNSATSPSVWVNVSNAVATRDTTPPSVVFSNPMSGQTVGSSTLTVTVNAADDAGAAGISQSLFIAGKLVASATGSTLSHNWNTRPLKKGSYTLQAVAKDGAGNTRSASITVKK
jgi:thermitase